MRPAASEKKKRRNGAARLALEAVGKAFARQAARFNLFNALDSLRSQNLGD